jgi:hypothetical protein
MEIEAWFLSMFEIFTKMSNGLTEGELIKIIDIETFVLGSFSVKYSYYSR